MSKFNLQLVIQRVLMFLLMADTTAMLPWLLCTVAYGSAVNKHEFKIRKFTEEMV